MRNPLCFENVAGMWVFRQGHHGPFRSLFGKIFLNFQWNGYQICGESKFLIVFINNKKTTCFRYFVADRFPIRRCHCLQVDNRSWYPLFSSSLAADIDLWTPTPKLIVVISFHSCLTSASPIETEILLPSGKRSKGTEAAWELYAFYKRLKEQSNNNNGDTEKKR